MIKVENLKKSFGTKHILKDINTVIEKGEVVVVIGPSGSGKSTFLRCLTRIEEPTSGKIWLDDEEITAPKADLNKIRARLGMVFQQFNLFPHLTVLDNVCLALIKVKKLSKKKAKHIAMARLREVDMEKWANDYPRHISGGQKQRVAIARALAMEPEVMLFDEPTSALDPEMTGEVLNVLRELAAKGTTMVIVTHEMSFARDVATKMLFLDGGKIVESGTPIQVMDKSKNPRVKQFFKKDI